MAEGQILFSLDAEKFQIALNLLMSRQTNCFNLQNDFKTKGVSLSQSLLAWGEGSGIWLLADFESQKTYDIERINGTGGNQTVEVSERPSEVEQPVTLTDTETILSRLKSAQGTGQGFIDFLKRLNLDELDLEKLKRSNLSEAGFSFEFIYPDLSIVHNMLREILSPSGKWAPNFQRAVAQNVVNHVQQFYEEIQKIKDFEISGENPRETHENLLQEIANFCDSVKTSLVPIVAYLSSRKVGQLTAETDDMVAKLKTETNRAEEINDETERKRAEREQEFNRLKIEVENKLAEKPISQYKTIFADQAKEHYKGARNWLKMAGGTTVLFFAAFVGLTIWLGSEDSGLTGTLRNLFTKGFLLSPIYVWLNRSIKN